MGKKAKTSRKGKKAWRANISTEDIQDFYEKSTKDALSGGSLFAVPSESLFFVDKSKDLSVKRKTLFKDNSEVALTTVDLWNDKGEDNIKVRKKTKPSVIPAVEVEPPGCSFNPSFESHQDTLAQAVAEEMQKVYRNELGPEPVPLTVPGKAIDEEDMYFLDADNETDDDTNLENADGNEGAKADIGPFKAKRVTRVELNKRARHKEQLRKEEETKKVEGLSKEIDCLPDIIQEIAKDDEEKQKKRLRLAIAKQERLKSCPPRLGKYKVVAILSRIGLRALRKED